METSFLAFVDLTAPGSSIERVLAGTRRGGFAPAVVETVSAILENVRTRGDAALVEYAARFDGLALEPTELALPRSAIDEALRSVPRELVRALERAAERVYDFHARDLPDGFSYRDEFGNELGVRVVPVERAGCYVPGGRAAYPSTVLMTVIPAKAAGVDDIVVCLPPGRDGGYNPATLAAIGIAGPDRVFRVGGAQAIAAMAYGTETVPRCDVVVGPGNAYVAAAKKLVQGDVAIDMIAGPSEVAIIADETADAEWLALDLMAQAEHDPDAICSVISPHRELYEELGEALRLNVARAARRETIEAALSRNARFFLVAALDDAVAAANAIAPEHLELAVADPRGLLRAVRAAGAVFLGHLTAESFGDYVLGPNHTLPTLGTARFSSPLSARTFLREMNVMAVSERGVLALYPDLAAIADAEGLEAHRESARLRAARLEREGGSGERAGA